MQTRKMIKTHNPEKWVEEFLAEQQKLADEAGVPLLVYMATAQGGILKNTIFKLVKHAQAHQNECPADCEFQASLENLKKKYRVE